jgi:hypothetical protein
MTDSAKPFHYGAIGLISAATILLEIALLRIFAVQQFYHFAFMAISLALLGAGASGSILNVRGRPYSPALVCMGFSATTLGAYAIINYLPFDSFSIAWDSRQIFFLTVYFLAAATPFLFAGLLVGGELMGVERAGRRAPSHLVYGANLIGSALGSLLSLPLLGALGGPGVVVATAMMGGAAALSLVRLEGYEPAGSRRQGPVAALAAAIVVSGAVALWRPPAILEQQLSPYKTLSVLSQSLDARHLLTTWDATARIDVIESPTIHVMPGLSLTSAVGLPEQLGLMLDGDNLMPISRLSPESEQARLLADAVPSGIIDRLRPGADTLVIEAGTGMDVLFALASGAGQVTVVEDNGLIIELMRDTFHLYNDGLYRRPQVEIVNQSGRVFARRSGQGEFGVTIVALTDPHRPVTSGAYSLTEEYTYTVEAFRDYFRTLDEDGLLMVTRWLQTPPSESARTFGAMAAALRAEGLEPAGHLLAFRTLRTMTILAFRQPITEREVGQTRTFLSERNFDAVYYPGLEQDELNRYSVLAEPYYHQLFIQVLASPRETYRDYRFDIRPPTDDRPFFFHYFRWRQTPEILATLGLTWQPFGGSGFFVLVVLLVVVAVGAAVLIMAPLLLKGRARARTPDITVPYWRLRVLFYYACLGLAFLFVEVPLAQRFILVLDEPVTALAVVIFGVLLFSGLGSLTVRRWSLKRALLLLVVLIAVYPLMLRVTGPLLLAQAGWLRAGLTVLLLAPLGYLMGLPFAGGLRVVERVEPALVPWVWAVNGSFSVISSVLAVTIALSWGFSAVICWARPPMAAPTWPWAG